MITTYKRMVIYLAVLVLFCIYLLNFHLPKKSGKEITEDVLQIFWKLYADLGSESQTDKTKMYRILYSNEFEKMRSLFDVTLVTQCSSNKLILLKNITKVWNGPISVAVFLDSNSLKESLLAAALLIYCKGVKSIGVSLVVDIKGYEKNLITNSSSFQRFYSCDNFYLTGISSNRNYERSSSPYPVNLLRNVAKRASKTDYVLVSDIDMVPNSNLRPEFLRFIDVHRMESEVVYVVPSFEVDEKEKIPSAKSQLIALIRESKARPFYFNLCAKCHNNTDYPKWLSYNGSLGTRKLYSVKYKDPWEPFYISQRNVPDYDERFKQYGFNRISQVCELHVAGYQFRVLDDVFLVHAGFKIEGDFHSTKDAEQERNRLLFRLFKKELKLKYQTSRRC